MSDCCTRIVQIPGPMGPQGEDGTNGTDGENAFTTVVAPVVAIPAANATTTITVVSTDWMVPTQVIYIQFAGYYQVIAIISGTQVSVKNLDYDGNTAAGPNFTVGARVGPGGLVGPDGSLTGAAGGQLTGTYPNPDIGVLTTKGDLLVTTGGGVGNCTRLAVGTDGMTLHADSGQASGLGWAKIDLADTAQVTGELDVNNGGTGANSAAGARTNLSAAGSGINSDIEELTGLTTPLSVGQGGTGGATVAVAQTNLDVLAKEGLLIYKNALDLNTAGDTLSIDPAVASFYITAIVVWGATISLTTATLGVFSAAGGLGTVFAADQSLAAVTGSTKYLELTLTDKTIWTTKVYFRVGTPQGAAATANVWIFGRRLA